MKLFEFDVVTGKNISSACQMKLMAKIAIFQQMTTRIKQIKNRQYLWTTNYY